MRDLSHVAEWNRLAEARTGVPWRRWGPYLSERQWGTVREDYSANGDAWAYFSHDQARSRAYHWGEDGLAGFSDDKGRMCMALALWNGRDPILKERLFGVTNAEGNHGEDVKEYYYYLDATPTHSYGRWLYKYPQAAYPYADLLAQNAGRSREALEYELIDTGVFAENRYFDVSCEYAKGSPDDILVRVTVHNRGPDPATLHVLPTLWFRNTWAWWPGTRPSLSEVGGAVRAVHPDIGERTLYCDGAPRLLFTENESNNERLFNGKNATPWVKDAFHALVVDGRQDAVNPGQHGTKAAAWYRLDVPAGGQATLRLRLTDSNRKKPFDDFDALMAARIADADAYYATITPPGASADEASVLRQAVAGMLWSKQHYFFDADRWLDEHQGHPLAPRSVGDVRNRDWFHMVNDDVISMPDKWEYPWYAAWDLAFHAVVLAGVDPEFAQDQLDLMLRNIYLHPSGQIPAYEWNFGDVNPPVHAWASLFVYRMDEAFDGEGDRGFLQRTFTKLLLNFTWWLNRKDRFGKNVFEGGFLGLDNIGVFDRSKPLPTGGYLEQADGTAWMAMFCQNMLEIAVELADENPLYEDMAGKFLDHFLFIAAAMNRVGDDGMWDEEDGFYYDVLRLPDGRATRLKVRSMVGLLPVCATTVVEPWQRHRVPKLPKQLADRFARMPSLQASIHPTGEGMHGHHGRGIFALVGPDRLRRILSRMLDENEFLGPYGIRSLSKWHEANPYVVRAGGGEYRVGYLPAESDTGMFGGNSNWRGPVWFPVNILLIRALLQFYGFHGNAFQVECPTGSGRMMNLFEVAKEISTRLVATFLRDENGRRPVYGGVEPFQSDPHFRDHVLFYEYFHGDLGAGIGASHQTGWTGLVALLIRMFGTLTAGELLEGGKSAAMREMQGNRG